MVCDAALILAALTTEAVAPLSSLSFTCINVKRDTLDIYPRWCDHAFSLCPSESPQYFGLSMCTAYQVQ